MYWLASGSAAVAVNLAWKSCDSTTVTAWLRLNDSCGKHGHTAMWVTAQYMTDATAMGFRGWVLSMTEAVALDPRGRTIASKSPQSLAGSIGVEDPTATA